MNTVLVYRVNALSGDCVRKTVVGVCGCLLSRGLRVHNVDNTGYTAHAAGLKVVSYNLAAVVTDSILVCICAYAFLSAYVTLVICIGICTVGDNLVTFVAEVIAVRICALGKNCATAVVTYVVAVARSICVLAHNLCTACKVTVVVLVGVNVLGYNPYALVLGCDVTNVVSIGVVAKCNCALVTYEVGLCINVLGNSFATAVVAKVIVVACSVCVLAHFCLAYVTCVILVFINAFGNCSTTVVASMIFVCISTLGENCFTNVTLVVLVAICTKVLAAVVTVVTLVITVCTLAAEAALTADIAVVGLVFVCTLGKLSTAITVVISDVALGAEACITSVTVVVCIDAVIAKSYVTNVTVVVVVGIKTVVSHVEGKIVEVAKSCVVPVTCLKAYGSEVHGADFLRGEVLSINESPFVCTAERPVGAYLVVNDFNSEGIPGIAGKRCINGRLLVLSSSAKEEEGVGSSITVVSVCKDLCSLLNVSNANLVALIILNVDVVTSTRVAVAVVEEVIEAKNVSITVAIITPEDSP